MGEIMIIVLTPESPIIRSVFARCELDQGHFMWTGGVSRGGGRKGDPYPTVWVPELKTSVRGHRLIFAAFFGTWEVPIGYHREHVCNRTLCLNPACMELVTQKENQRRRAWRAQADKEGKTGMICPECKEAGDIVTAVKTAPSSHMTAIIAVIRENHGRCRGATWCDCQNQIPELLIKHDHALYGPESHADGRDPLSGIAYPATG
jgi:hypothetical protein